MENKYTYCIESLLLVQELSDVLCRCSQHALLLQVLHTPLGLFIKSNQNTWWK